MKGTAIALLTCVWLLSPAAFAQRTFGTLVIVEDGPLPAGPSPLSAETPSEWRFVELTYAPLFSVDPNGAAVPYLAENAKSLEGGKKLQVSIRGDAIWHNGRSVTVSDVIYTYTLARAGKWNKAWVDQLRPIQSVTTTNDGFDLLFEFKSPQTNATQLLTVPLLPNGLHGPLNNEERQRPLPRGVLGAGPYVPAGANKLHELNVFKDAVRKPRISAIRLMTAGNRSIALDLVRMMGNAVTFDARPEDAAMLNQEFGVRMLKMPGQRLLVLAYNPEESLLGKRRFRDAVKAGIDRKEFILQGEPGRPTPAPVSTKSAHFPRGMSFQKRDNIEARRILWWSDWERDSDQIFFLKEGALSNKEPAEIELLIDGDSRVDLRRAAILKQRMLEAAIRVKLDVRPRFEFQGKVRARTYSTALVSLDMPQDGSLAPVFHSKGGRNVLAFSDPEVDKAFDSNNTDAAIKKIMEKAPVIFLGLQRRVGAAGSKVKGSTLIGRGGLGRIEKWQIR